MLELQNLRSSRAPQKVLAIASASLGAKPAEYVIGVINLTDWNLHSKNYSS
jgi:hypothetical protein